jgi:hypothetical protein
MRGARDIEAASVEFCVEGGVYNYNIYVKCVCLGLYIMPSVVCSE